MKTFALFVAGFIFGTVVMNACGKKVESAPTPVNPQITDAVTQGAVAVAPVDAGVVESVVKADPDPKPVEVPAVQSVPESK